MKFLFAGTDGMSAPSGIVAECRDLALIPSHDRHFASQVQCLNHAGVGHFGHFGVVGLEQRHAGHVFGRSVAVGRDDRDLLIGPAIHDATFWQALDTGNVGVFVGAVGHPLLNPARD